MNTRKLLTLLVLLLATACDGGGGSSSTSVDRPTSPFLLGAHYYVWYPRNFSQGFLRAKLEPPQEPMLGLYESASPRVAETHIELASGAGIDFFTLDWWRNSPQRIDAIFNGFLKASNLSKMKFCIFYETGELGFSSGTGATFITDTSIENFLKDLEIFQSKLFSNSQYLRVGGRPVLILYVTRTFSGKYREMIERGRAYLKERGTDVFLIGDEIFWAVTAVDAQSPPSFTDQPQPERIAMFDAITAYNVYESQFPQHAGYGADSSFFSDVNALYAKYRDAAGDIPILPSVIPGYNDRGVRPGENHFAIPRRISADAPEGSFLGEMFDRVLFPNLDAELPIGFITSWNEWNEDTAIEPVAPDDPTVRDQSSSGNYFTQGYAYTGYGTAHLDVVREKKGQ